MVFLSHINFVDIFIFWELRGRELKEYWTGGGSTHLFKVLLVVNQEIPVARIQGETSHTSTFKRSVWEKTPQHIKQTQILFSKLWLKEVTSFKISCYANMNCTASCSIMIVGACSMTAVQLKRLLTAFPNATLQNGTNITIMHVFVFFLQGFKDASQR